ncbi:hypothetical protein CBR_g6277 [Chara braunii]|uniref:Uncharacterized protein n=1 Tax=Chara braunii TaxID=69332 RepID=A0A388KJE4_CHABU|nr:hypothetical protein CBR_g6277 [Chara braunii]|eukprot:GBG70146.1 hypothetical protein CBR_g6277 [Chara braunii]
MDLGKGRYEATNFPVTHGDPGVADSVVDAGESRVLLLMRETGEIVGVDGREGARDSSVEILVIFTDGNCARDNEVNFDITIKFPLVHTEKKDMERKGGDEGVGGSVRDDSDKKAGGVELVEERGRERAPSIREWGSAQELVRGEEVKGTTGKRPGTKPNRPYFHEGKEWLEMVEKTEPRIHSFGGVDFLIPLQRLYQILRAVAPDSAMDRPAVTVVASFQTLRLSFALRFLPPPLRFSFLFLFASRGTATRLSRSTFLFLLL